MVTFLVAPAQKPAQNSKLLVYGDGLHTLFPHAVNETGYTVFIELIEGQFLVEVRKMIAQGRKLFERGRSPIIQFAVDFDKLIIALPKVFVFCSLLFNIHLLNTKSSIFFGVILHVLAVWGSTDAVGMTFCSSKS